MAEDYGMRESGSGKKYTGWKGELKRLDNPNQVSTEISTTVGLNGKEVEIPLIVPTLNKKELDFLLSVDPKSKEFGARLPSSVMKKAIDHAVTRMKLGKSPFKEPEDDQ
ncbi:hypothetical protein UFOVP765_23 [uncultured Caudovirales phage]|uniref:Uncharacterized protein n=1 Tax=uncultured Caudovirales phage TaxID=2100421 RepID=A0A6J5NZD6_9CAUD|nr:hypothetical protein UFOVP765_23 [uncultured Caudovirales phage]